MHIWIWGGIAAFYTIAAILVAVIARVTVAAWPRQTQPQPHQLKEPYRLLQAIELGIAFVLAIGTAITLPSMQIQSLLPFDTARNGIMIMLSPLFGLMVLLFTLLIFELILVRYMPRNNEPATAMLDARTAQKLVPHTIQTLLIGWASLTVTLSIIGLTIGSSDGQSLARTFADGTTATAGPFPGWKYTSASTIGLAVILVSYFKTLDLIAHRPRLAGLNPTQDLLYRRRLATSTAITAQFFLALLPAGLLWFGSNAIARLYREWTSITTITNVLATIGLTLIPIALLAPIIILAKQSTRKTRR